MCDKVTDFSVVFQKLEEFSDEADCSLSDEERAALDEIRALREIVLEMQQPARVYFTTS